MIFVSLFFAILGAIFAFDMLSEDPGSWLGWINFLSFVLNIFPVIRALL